MPYPPLFDSGSVVANRYDLDKISVLVDEKPESISDSMYFNIVGIPNPITFGKHYFTIGFKGNNSHKSAIMSEKIVEIGDDAPILHHNPGPTGKLWPRTTPHISIVDNNLREGSPVLFEFKDSNNNVIFSDLTTFEDINGNAVAYIWVKEDPLRNWNDIENGSGTFTIVAELDNVPNEWVGNYNYRCTLPIEIQKDRVNSSPILFQSSSLIASKLNLSESIHTDKGLNELTRSYMNISASHMHTFGGQVRYIEVSYMESSSFSDDFKVLAQYVVTGSDNFEITASSSKGLNPISHQFQFPMPRDITRDGKVNFELRFKNVLGEVAQDISTGKELIITASNVGFEGTPLKDLKGDGNIATKPQLSSLSGSLHHLIGKTAFSSSEQLPSGIISGTAQLNAYSASIKTSVKNDLIGSAPSTLDTLQEIATALDDSASLATELLTSLGGKASTDLSNLSNTGKSNISGSFTKASSSFSTRVTINDAKLTADATNVGNAGALMDSEVTDLTLVKGLTASKISGSQDKLSGSLHHMIGKTVHSASGQVSLNSLAEKNFGSLANKPTTIGGYGITDAPLKTEVSGAMDVLSGSVHHMIGKTVHSASGQVSLNSLAEKNFSSLANKPTTVSGYGITDAADATKISGSFTVLSGSVHHMIGKTVHSASAQVSLNSLAEKNFSSLANKPTTVSGYGITDAAAADKISGSFAILSGSVHHIIGKGIVSSSQQTITNLNGQRIDLRHVSASAGAMIFSDARLPNSQFIIASGSELHQNKPRITIGGSTIQASEKFAMHISASYGGLILTSSHSTDKFGLGGTFKNDGLAEFGAAVKVTGDVYANKYRLSNGAIIGGTSVPNTHPSSDGYPSSSAGERHVVSLFTSLADGSGETFTMTGSQNLNLQMNMDQDASNLHGNAGLTRLSVTGSISASAIHTPSITASAGEFTNLSVAGNLSPTTLTATQLIVASDIVHQGDTHTSIDFGADTISIEAGGSTNIRSKTNSTQVFQPLTASGDISASGNLIASSLNSDAINAIGSNITIGHPTTFASHITASGNISASGGTITAKEFVARRNLEGVGGYGFFVDRDDTGMYENNFSVAIQAPENVLIHIDSNNNNDDDTAPRQFAVLRNTDVIDSNPNDNNPLFQVFEDGRTLFHSASVNGITFNNEGHITASGDISSSGHMMSTAYKLKSPSGGDEISVLTIDGANNVAVGDPGMDDPLYLNGDLSYMHITDGKFVFNTTIGNATSKVHWHQADMFVGSHITASGNISSSGTGIFNNLEIRGADGTLAADYIIHKDDDNTKFGFPQNDKFKIRTAGTDRYVVDTIHQFTGEISASGGITASSGIHISDNSNSAGTGLLVSGSVEASGSITGHTYHMLTHNFDWSNSSTYKWVFLPTNTIAEINTGSTSFTSVQGAAVWPMPFAGCIHRVYLGATEANLGGVYCKVVKFGNPQAGGLADHEIIASSTTGKTLNAGSSGSFTFTNHSWNPGDLIGVCINRNTTSAFSRVTLSTTYKLFTNEDQMDF